MSAAVEALKQPSAKPGDFEGLGGRLIERVRAVAQKLNEKLSAKAGGKETPSTEVLGAALRKLGGRMNVADKLKRIKAALAEVAKLEGAALPVVTAAEVPK